MGDRRARGARINDERWEAAHRLSDGHPSTLLSQAIDLLQEAAQHAGGRDVVEWLREAIALRSAMSPGKMIGGLKDRQRFSLSERARYDPTGTQLEIGKAWLEARGDRERAMQILGIDAAQWQRALRHLPGLSDALRQLCPAARS